MVGIPNGEVKFFQWPVRKLQEIWPMVAPYAKSIVDRVYPKVDGHDFINNILSGQWQLWIGWVPEDRKIIAIMITRIEVYKNGEKCAHMIYLTGDHRDKWQDLVLPAIEKWAIAEGCSYQSGWCRPGWEEVARRHGFRKTHVLIEKKLPKKEVDDGLKRRNTNHHPEIGSLERGSALST